MAVKTSTLQHGGNLQTRRADFLSRHPLEAQPTSDRNIADVYVNYIMGNAIPKSLTLTEIEDAACRELYNAKAH